MPEHKKFHIETSKRRDRTFRIEKPESSNKSFLISSVKNPSLPKRRLATTAIAGAVGFVAIVIALILTLLFGLPNFGIGIDHITRGVTNEPSPPLTASVVVPAVANSRPLPTPITPRVFNGMPQFLFDPGAESIAKSVINAIETGQLNRLRNLISGSTVYEYYLEGELTLSSSQVLQDLQTRYSSSAVTCDGVIMAYYSASPPDPYDSIWIATSGWSPPWQHPPLCAAGEGCIQASKSDFATINLQKINGVWDFVGLDLVRASIGSARLTPCH